MSWQPACTAPYNKEVIVKGDSGYATMPTFIINAIRTHENPCWVDATGTPLTDRGWIPEWWWRTNSSSTTK